MFKIATVFVSLVAALALSQAAAMAADSKNAAPKYKKVAGEVVSATPTSIVIKGKGKKGPITLAVTDKTDMIGAKAAKTGDRAQVNYRVDENGNTATKIKVLSVSAKAVSPAEAPASAASPPKPN
jgi:hypothetical protein